MTYIPENAIGYAKSQLGVTEVPNGSNCQPYSAWQYGVRCPGGGWCQSFASKCAVEAGFQFGGDATYGAKGFSYTESAEQWARNHGLWRDKWHRFGVGDWIIFDWNGDGMTDHVEVVNYDDGVNILTVGGNTGNAVMFRNRDRGFMVGGVALSESTQAVRPIDPAVLNFLKRLNEWKNRICAPATPDGMHGPLRLGMTNSNVTILNNMYVATGLLAKKSNTFNEATRRATWHFKRIHKMSNTVGKTFACEAATAMLKPKP